MNDEIKKIMNLMKEGLRYRTDLYNSEKSIECFEKVIELDPNCKDRYNIDAYFWAAYGAWEYIADYEKAITLLKKAILLNNRRADLYVLWSWLMKSTDNVITDCDFILTDITAMHEAYHLEPTWFTPMLYLLEHKECNISKSEIQKALKEFKDIPKTPGTPEEQAKRQYEFFITGRWNKEYKEKLEKYL